MTFFRKPKKQITQREIASIHAFYAPAYGKEPPEVPKARARPRQLEHIEAVSLMKWWRINHARMGLPEIALFAIPNGGARDEVTASKMKQEGVTPGVYDYMMPVAKYQYHGLFVELKAQNGRISNEQIDFGTFLVSQRYCGVVAVGWQNAAKEILKYMGQEQLWRGA
jgi:hypothetical protein